MIKKDGYEFRKSKRHNKKYDVFKKGVYIISFGQLPYQHYRDKIGLYSHLDHNDSQRRKNYYARHGKEAEKDSAKYFSHRYLW
jgi:hypothetical protein